MFLATKWLRPVLIVVSILGGLSGVVLTVVGLLQTDVAGIGAALLCAVAMAAYACVAIAGIALWRYPNEWRPMICALAIQVPWISFPGFVYKYSAGLSGTLALITKYSASEYSMGFTSSWDLLPSWEFRLFQNAPVQLGINVMPMIALLLIWKVTQPIASPEILNSEEGAHPPLS